MLVFIIPLKSAKVSNSWERVSLLLERTLRSICHQTCAKYKVIVVCHEKPDINFNHSNLTYLSVDFPIPTWERSDDYDTRRIDKQKKIFMGLNYASRFNPTHVMFVDADDCVSKYLAEFVSQNPQSNGWNFAQGYEYIDGRKNIFLLKKNFSSRCGTSNIVKYDLVKPEPDFKIDDVYPRWLFHGRYISKQLRDKGYSLEVLPFPGAVYIIDNGTNIYSQKQIRIQSAHSIYKKTRVYLVDIGKRILLPPLTDAIREEFGLYDIQALSNANNKSNLVTK
ncbi:glycosyltransferase family 2 protein [Pleurocapsales cyanobacterium LEGE 10410]|nr:glycosyltransferase family 2 protein [Pleurocapsales cyanobacterium LEGE 10410]